MIEVIFRWLKRIVIIFFTTSILSVIILKYLPVYFTPLMGIRAIEQMVKGKTVSIEHEWVPIEEISKQMPQAVVASEDNLFLHHSGFDFKQIELAQKEAESGKRVRGASTISQQTAKNVFLWPGKSYLRKGLEAYFTVLIEFVWGKERIMEVYLNSIETGDGIFGVEALANNKFIKNAKNFSKADAALIAATLPNPRRFDSANPSKYMLKRQKQIMSLMNKIETIRFGEEK